MHLLGCAPGYYQQICCLPGQLNSNSRGIVIFKNANPHLPPPQPVSVVDAKPVIICSRERNLEVERVVATGGINGIRKI